MVSEFQYQEPHVEDMPQEEPINIEPIYQESIGIRRSTRNRKTSISSDYIVYLQEFDLDVGLKDDPIAFSQAINRDDSKLWYESMKDEMESIAKNQVWDLVELAKGVSPIVINVNFTKLSYVFYDVYLTF